MSDLETAVHHLKKAVCLCTVPRDMWNDQDSAILKEAREFIKQFEEENASEGEGPKENCGVVGGSVEVQNGATTEGRVLEEGLPLEEGVEGSD